MILVVRMQVRQGIPLHHDGAGRSHPRDDEGVEGESVIILPSRIGGRDLPDLWSRSWSLPRLTFRVTDRKREESFPPASLRRIIRRRAIWDRKKNAKRMMKGARVSLVLDQLCLSHMDDDGKEKDNLRMAKREQEGHIKKDARPARQQMSGAEACDRPH